jgi:hexosaminidase
MTSLPELTAVGSQPGHSTVRIFYLLHDPGPIQKLAGSGYYTRADFIEILRYANARHIMVLPEIERRDCALLNP